MIREKQNEDDPIFSTEEGEVMSYDMEMYRVFLITDGQQRLTSNYFSLDY